MLFRAAFALALLLVAPLAAQAANFPGWTRTYQDGGIVLVSPKDDLGVVQMFLVPAEKETGNVQVEFSKALDVLVSGMGADMTLAKRSGLRTQGGLMFEVLTTMMEGVPIDVLVFCYDTGGSYYQIGLLAYLSIIPDTDPRVGHALDFIATATRTKYRMTDPRAFDRTAPTAQTVTAYTTTKTAPAAPPPPANPPQKTAGKRCERRPIWGFRISYWCQPSGICNDRVIKGYEDVCE